jgi:hypothetical protein
LRDLTNMVDGVALNVASVGRLVEDSARHLGALLQQQALTLGALVEHQERLELGLAVIREQLAGGFATIHEALRTAEGRREQRELEARMRTMLRQHEICVRALAAGEAPPEADLRRVMDLAGEVAGWIDTRAAGIAVGGPERVPLLVARGIALRIELDARHLAGAAPAALAPEVDAFLRTIAEEARAMANEASTYSLAVTHAPFLAQYVYLHRAFRVEPAFVTDTSGRTRALLPAEAVDWDDGLDAARAAFTDGPNDAELALETLADQRWYQRVQGLPPQAPPPPAISLRDLARVLGAPDGIGVDPKHVPLLRGLALPERREAIRRRVLAAFGEER